MLDAPSFILVFTRPKTGLALLSHPRPERCATNKFSSEGAPSCTIRAVNNNFLSSPVGEGKYSNFSSLKISFTTSNEAPSAMYSLYFSLVNFRLSSANSEARNRSFDIRAFFMYS